MDRPKLPFVLIIAWIAGTIVGVVIGSIGLIGSIVHAFPPINVWFETWGILGLGGAIVAGLPVSFFMRVQNHSKAQRVLSTRLFYLHLLFFALLTLCAVHFFSKA